MSLCHGFCHLIKTWIPLTRRSSQLYVHHNSHFACGFLAWIEGKAQPYCLNHWTVKGKPFSPINEVRKLMACNPIQPQKVLIMTLILDIHHQDLWLWWSPMKRNILEKMSIGGFEFEIEELSSPNSISELLLRWFPNKVFFEMVYPGQKCSLVNKFALVRNSWSRHQLLQPNSIEISWPRSFCYKVYMCNSYKETISYFQWRTRNYKAVVLLKCFSHKLRI